MMPKKHPLAQNEVVRLEVLPRGVCIYIFVAEEVVVALLPPRGLGVGWALGLLPVCPSPREVPGVSKSLCIERLSQMKMLAHMDVSAGLVGPGFRSCGQDAAGPTCGFAASAPHSR
jgi:hypothetical protein